MNGPEVRTGLWVIDQATDQEFGMKQLIFEWITTFGLLFPIYQSEVLMVILPEYILIVTFIMVK